MVFLFDVHVDLDFACYQIDDDSHSIYHNCLLWLPSLFISIDSTSIHNHISHRPNSNSPIGDTFVGIDVFYSLSLFDFFFPFSFHSPFLAVRLLRRTILCLQNVSVHRQFSSANILFHVSIICMYIYLFTCGCFVALLLTILIQSSEYVMYSFRPLRASTHLFPSFAKESLCVYTKCTIYTKSRAF